MEKTKHKYCSMCSSGYQGKKLSEFMGFTYNPFFKLGNSGRGHICGKCIDKLAEERDREKKEREGND